MNEGWLCPRCDKINAPRVKACSCSSKAKQAASPVPEVKVEPTSARVPHVLTPMPPRTEVPREPIEKIVDEIRRQRPMIIGGTWAGCTQRFS